TNTTFIPSLLALHTDTLFPHPWVLLHIGNDYTTSIERSLNQSTKCLTLSLSVPSSFSPPGLKGGGPSAGGGVPGGPNFSYSFQGDPHAIFAEFFGGRSPFDQFFPRNGGGPDGDNMDTDDLFARFGMGGGGMGGFPRSFSTGMGGGMGGQMVEKHQDPPMLHDLRVTLEEVFSGCTKRMKISHKRLNADRRTTRTEDKILEVEIKKGWKEGTKITFPKEGDETPTNIPADVVFVVKDKPHPVFRREGSDIVYPAKVSLREALCGCTVNAPTLDGRTVTVTTGDVVRPGMKRRITGEGLPHPKRPDRRGDLLVEYEVVFPERLSQSAKETIAQVLPP
ncbi:dnaJ homolog subfamily B member 1, partial [Coregonus clupeaformis]|uniref:dnaJ homolog subfamily B member 1 n=1 Tax=Coregonus clupeaformis TaxID=59861 RepID=UPI001E1C5832